MLVSVTKCPDKHFRRYVDGCIQFCAEALIDNKKILNNLIINVKFDPNLSVLGYASIDGYNTMNHPREFLIEVNPDIGARGILETLTHEMVHVKQYINGEIDETLKFWKGRKFDSDSNDYYSHPWEIEAIGISEGLFTKYVEKEKLWKVFNGIYNPKIKSRAMKLGWKNPPDFRS